MTGNATLQFLGAAGTVTGSRYLLTTTKGTKILIDCGLFQGPKHIRKLNWETFAVAPDSLDAVILTHAHIDHSGYLPALVRDGFAGSIYATRATRDLCTILLTDSAHIMEKDAERANRYGYTRHAPAKPLYAFRDVERTMERFKSVDYDASTSISDDVLCEFRQAGHILGAASIVLRMAEHSICFSGDLGRINDPLALPPDTLPKVGSVVIESTYGDTKHGTRDPVAVLGNHIEDTVGRGGTIVIPAFTVGRTQNLLFYFSVLKNMGRLKNVPIYLDSPMAINVSDLYEYHADLHRLTPGECHKAFAVADYVRDPEISKTLDAGDFPRVILSASGMATGGRVLHHLKAYIGDPKSLILFTGFQPPGTRGEKLLSGSAAIKIHGHNYEVRAQIAWLDMLSAHADARELLNWLTSGPAPARVFITHGTPDAAAVLAQDIARQTGLDVELPQRGDIYDLPARVGPIEGR